MRHLERIRAGYPRKDRHLRELPSRQGRAPTRQRLHAVSLIFLENCQERTRFQPKQP